MDFVVTRLKIVISFLVNKYLAIGEQEITCKKSTSLHGKIYTLDLKTLNIIIKMECHKQTFPAKRPP
jgi:hypothetical protein